MSVLTVMRSWAVGLAALARNVFTPVRSIAGAPRDADRDGPSDAVLAALHDVLAGAVSARLGSPVRVVAMVVTCDRGEMARAAARRFPRMFDGQPGAE